MIAKHTPGGCCSLPMNLNVGQASRLPSRRSRRQNGLRARACALTGEAARLPYVAGFRGAMRAQSSEDSLPITTRGRVRGN